MTARPEILTSNLVPGFEHVEIALGLACPRCPGVRSLIPADLRLTNDSTIELLCPCGSTTLLSVDMIEWEEVEEEGATS